MLTKVCTKCGHGKPLEAFHRHKGCKDGRRGQCAECVLERKRQYDESTNYASQTKYRSSPRGRASIRRTRLRQYGLTPQQYDRMAESQGHLCLICQAVPDDGVLHVDHCHTTGKVRGLLCRWCNRGLGHFQDQPDLLRQAADYLSR